MVVVVGSDCMIDCVIGKCIVDCIDERFGDIVVDYFVVDDCIIDIVCDQIGCIG